MGMADIVVIGSLNMDLVVKVDRMPNGGETVPGGNLHLICGGKGANQAVAASRLGAKVAMVGRVGEDDFGQRLLDNLDQASIVSEHVIRDANSVTGTAVILVDERGENSIVVSPGANGFVSPADVTFAEEIIRNAKIVLLQLEIPIPAVEKAIDLARKYDVMVLLNPAPARKVPAEMLTKVNMLIPNETEAGFYTGIEVHDVNSAMQAGNALVEMGIEKVIITLGDKGALYVSSTEEFHIPARKVKAIDTTAAGDAFIGGVSAAIVKGFLLKQAMEYGCCAGALAATRLGAQTSLPAVDEVDQFYAQK
jgi:ribokinase